MIRRELYTEAGGLDPTFFAHMEENRPLLAPSAGWIPMRGSARAKVYHLGGGSLPPPRTHARHT